MKTFEIGKTYNMRSACDHECIWTYTVTKRTAKTITIEDESGKAKTCRISEGSTGEKAYPLGRYSMAPILRA